MIPLPLPLFCLHAHSFQVSQISQIQAQSAAPGKLEPVKLTSTTFENGKTYQEYSRKSQISEILYIELDEDGKPVTQVPEGWKKTGSIHTGEKPHEPE